MNAVLDVNQRTCQKQSLCFVQFLMCPAQHSFQTRTFAVRSKYLQSAHESRSPVLLHCQSSFTTHGELKRAPHAKLDPNPKIHTSSQKRFSRPNEKGFPPNSLPTTTIAKDSTSSNMGFDVTIRSACLSDAEDLHAISLCPGVRLNTSKMPYMPIGKIRQQLENPGPGDVKLVAVIDQRVIGTIGIHVNSNPARKHAAYIGMAVHDECQGCGIGSRLLTEAINLAERWMGLRRLELEVFSRNERALNLYKRHGFKVEGCLKEYAFRDGEFVDAVAMARVAGLNK